MSKEPIHPGHITLTRADRTTIEETIADGNGIATILDRHGHGDFVEAAHGGGNPDAEPLTVWRWRPGGDDAFARWHKINRSHPSG